MKTWTNITNCGNLFGMEQQRYIFSYRRKALHAKGFTPAQLVSEYENKYGMSDPDKPSLFEYFDFELSNSWEYWVATNKFWNFIERNNYLVPIQYARSNVASLSDKSLTLFIIKPGEYIHSVGGLNGYLHRSYKKYVHELLWKDYVSPAEVVVVKDFIDNWVPSNEQHMYRIALSGQLPSVSASTVEHIKRTLKFMDLPVPQS